MSLAANNEKTQSAHKNHLALALLILKGKTRETADIHLNRVPEEFRIFAEYGFLQAYHDAQRMGLVPEAVTTDEAVEAMKKCLDWLREEQMPGWRRLVDHLSQADFGEETNIFLGLGASAVWVFIVKQGWVKEVETDAAADTAEDN